MGGLVELTIVWIGRNWDLIGFLNGDLSGLVGTLLFSVVVVEGDVGVEWMETIKTPFGFLGRVLYVLAFSVVLSTNPHVSYCLYQVSVLLIRYDYGWIMGWGCLF